MRKERVWIATKQRKFFNTNYGMSHWVRNWDLSSQFMFVFFPHLFSLFLQIASWFGWRCLLLGFQASFSWPCPSCLLSLPINFFYQHRRNVLITLACLWKVFFLYFYREKYTLLWLTYWSFSTVSQSLHFHSQMALQGTFTKQKTLP